MLQNGSERAFVPFPHLQMAFSHGSSLATAMPKASSRERRLDWRRCCGWGLAEATDSAAVKEIKAKTFMSSFFFFKKGVVLCTLSGLAFPTAASRHNILCRSVYSSPPPFFTVPCGRARPSIRRHTRAKPQRAG